MRHILSIIIFLLVTSTAMAQLRVEHFVRVKGQEATEITAYGIVGGLNGTGDDPRNYSPHAEAILRQLARSGMFVGNDLATVRGARNSALVRVVVTIPGTGAREGDVLDCVVYSEGSAESLAGGILSPTALHTVLPQDDRSLLQGFAQGKIVIEDTASPRVGRIVDGCRLRANFENPYIRNGLITLIIKREHARPSLANRIAEAINNDPELQMLSLQPARVFQQNEVVVRVPPTSFADPMDFLARILDAEMMDVPRPVPRVTINERARTIAIDVDVEVRPTLVTYNGIIADIAPELEEGEMEEFPRQFIDIDTDTRFRQMSGENVNNVKLRALQASLNALQATQQDTIEIIKILEKQGAIIGEVVFVD